MSQLDWSARVWCRIAIVVCVFAVAAFLADHTATCARVLAPLDIMTARSVEQILVWLGSAPQRDGATLVEGGGFAYEIAFPCTGLMPAGLLAAAIIAAGGSLRARLWGAVAGTTAVLVLNFFRLVSLFYVGILFPRAFEIAHSVIWQGLTVLFVFGFFSLWGRSVLSHTDNRAV